MKTIKYKILFSFLITVICIGVIIGGLMSWKLNQGFSHQTQVLVEDVAAQNNRTLDGYNDLLRSFIAQTQDSIRSSADAVSKNPLVAKHLEAQHLGPLFDLLSRECTTTGMDFAFVFDLNGKMNVSVPKKVDAGTLRYTYLMGLRFIAAVYTS